LYDTFLGGLHHGGSGGGKDNGGNNNCGGHKQLSTQSGSKRNGVGAAAVAMETATAMEMATVTATKMSPTSTPTTGYKQQQQRRCILEVSCGNRPHCRLAFPLPPPLPLPPCGNVGSNGDNNNTDSGSGDINKKDNCWKDGRSDHSWCLV
jgi:hypothetical protein